LTRYGSGMLLTPVSELLFLGCFLAGAGALAIWVDARFPSLMPGMRGIVLHLMVAFVLVQIGARLVAPAVADLSIPGAKLIAVIAIVLPLIAYAALAALWMLRLARDPLGAR
jgi:hypothetical protein